MANMMLQTSFLGSTFGKPSLELKVRLRCLELIICDSVVVLSRCIGVSLSARCGDDVADGSSRICRLAMVRER